MFEIQKISNDDFKRKNIKSFLYIVVIILLLGISSLYFIFANKKLYKKSFIKKENVEILKQISKKKYSFEKRFYLFRQAEKMFKSPKNILNLLKYISNYVTKYPKDPYNSYYYYYIGQNYYKEKIKEVALVNYKNSFSSKEVILNGTSTHLESLKKIVELEKDYPVKSLYYKLLVNKIPEIYKSGKNLEEKTKIICDIYYNYTKFLKDLGEYKKVYKYYKKIVNMYKEEYPKLQSRSKRISYMQGVPNYFYEAENQYDFYKSNKDWVFSSLEKLESAVRSAIVNGNPYRLLSYRSKVDFFAMTYTQDKKNFSAKRQAYSRLITSVLLYSNRIRVASFLEKASTPTEAYLKTYGWNHSLPNWHFYFRKVDYPLDKDIDGGWEWAGIYMGEIF